MKNIKIGSDFSGVGAFDFAIGRIAKQKGFKVENVFACDMDKYARQSYLANHDSPGYYPVNVYDRPIPEESLDIYMTSPPCQSFSLAGKRKGKDSENGVLFFNSHEFIKENKPRFFIFENVKGLLSDDKGRTFQEWIDWLGGKSVNGLPVLFKNENAVDYHIYWKVLNSKKHGVPQNRERVFIIGIRDDVDNHFRFPKEEYLKTKLKDILQSDVDSKYFLSEKVLENLLIYNQRQKENKTGFSAKFRDVEITKTMDTLKCGGQGKDDLIKVKNATSKGYEVATDSDSINFSQPNSKTRRGRVGKKVAQTLETSCNQGIFNGNTIRKLTPRECFRLQDFPDSFEFVVSDTQLYKQAGNSITVRVLELIINNLKL